MKQESEGKRVRIYVDASDQWQGKNLYTAIVKRCHEEGIANAVAWRGIEGYGANMEIHGPDVFSLKSNLPVMIEIVDDAEKIEKLLPILDAMISEGLMTASDVHTVKYSKATSNQR
ncbi:hypothetical protein ANRL1_00552 [Anaerolineae bacterium]|nr:hypothetical protein ANRL1_00552 [Anaerolineae bacterium]